MSLPRPKNGSLRVGICAIEPPLQGEVTSGTVVDIVRDGMHIRSDRIRREHSEGRRTYPVVSLLARRGDREAPRHDSEHGDHTRNRSWSTQRILSVRHVSSMRNGLYRYGGRDGQSIIGTRA